MDFFHVLNRGVDKRTVFLDEQDHLRFVHDLFEFNDTKPAGMNNYHFNKSQEYSDIGCPNISNEKRELLVYLHCFALMPNHYHLLLSPAVESGISLFMKKLNMGYSKYFNEKYERSGALWQGKYKSVAITSDAHFLHIPFYIHFNPFDMHFPEWRKRRVSNQQRATAYLNSYRWSSHRDYLGEKNFPSVTQRTSITGIFRESGGYKKIFRTELRNFSLESVADMTLE